MRDVIKKILKEETDWIGDIDPNNMWLSFIYERIKEPNYQYMAKWNDGRMYDFFEEVRSGLSFCESDLHQALDHAKKGLDDSLTPQERINELDGAIDYAFIGSMAESAQEGLRFFEPYLLETKEPFMDLLEKATKYFNR